MPDSAFPLTLTAHSKDIGAFSVARILPQAARRHVGPFVFLDHFGPATYAPGFPRDYDVRPHPHIGLSTLSYLFEGEITHRDSLGAHVAIQPGEVNWMTAGRGITHSERFEHLRAEGGALHGLQAWVALPEADEDCEPSFEHYGADGFPDFSFPGVRLRLIAGKAFGHVSPVRTHSPLFYLSAELDAGAALSLDGLGPERAIYVVSGAAAAGGAEAEAHQMLVFEPGAPVTVTAKTPSVIMILGGEPLGPRFIEWNFVSSSKAKIEAAKDDWRAGRMKLPVGDDQEFIPYG